MSLISPKSPLRSLPPPPRSTSDKQKQQKQQQQQREHRRPSVRRKSVPRLIEENQAAAAAAASSSSSSSSSTRFASPFSSQPIRPARRPYTAPAQERHLARNEGIEAAAAAAAAAQEQARKASISTASIASMEEDQLLLFGTTAASAVERDFPPSFEQLRHFARSPGSTYSPKQVPVSLAGSSGKHYDGNRYSSSSPSTRDSESDGRESEVVSDDADEVQANAKDTFAPSYNLDQRYRSSRILSLSIEEQDHGHFNASVFEWDSESEQEFSEDEQDEGTGDNDEANDDSDDGHRRLVGDVNEMAMQDKQAQDTWPTSDRQILLGIAF